MVAREPALHTHLLLEHTGSVYYQSKSPLLVMSGFCVYSVASALFMFPALYLYYQRALEVYTYEHADGVGSPWDIVIQGFIRGITLGFFPVIMCASVLYLLVGVVNFDDVWADVLPHIHTPLTS